MFESAELGHRIGGKDKQAGFSGLPWDAPMPREGGTREPAI